MTSKVDEQDWGGLTPLVKLRVRNLALVGFARQLFGECADKLRIVIEVGRAVALPGARLQLIYSVGENAFIVLCDAAPRQTRCIGLDGEVIDPDSAQLLQERADILIGVLTKQLQAQGQGDGQLPSSPPSELVKLVEPIIAALPDESVLIEVVNKSYVVPPRSKAPVVAMGDLSFDDCCVVEIKFPSQARVHATPSSGGPRRTLRVELQENSVPSRRLGVMALAGASFSMKARELRNTKGGVTYVPSEVLSLDAVTEQIRFVMRQAELPL